MSTCRDSHDRSIMSQRPIMSATLCTMTMPPPRRYVFLIFWFHPMQFCSIFNLHLQVCRPLSIATTRMILQYHSSDRCQLIHLQLCDILIDSWKLVYINSLQKKRCEHSVLVVFKYNDILRNQFGLFVEWTSQFNWKPPYMYLIAHIHLYCNCRYPLTRPSNS